jgi:nucleotide-binding universal stress UspA family protein
MTETAPASGSDRVVFAYDGSDLAKAAIDEAGRQLTPARDALVLTVWEPFAVGFVPPSDAQLDAEQTTGVKKAAEQTAAEGATLAETAGFRAQSRVVQSAPTWKGIVEFADENDAGIIVLGSHGRTGLADRLLGSVAAAVAAHSRRSVLIVHRRP